LARFSPEKLEKVISEVSVKTAENISSMRQDVRAERKTEIDYINGYIIARGAEHGIECPQHSRLVRLVKKKALISESQIPEIFQDLGI
jgi:2-dehydropantoate 2-reductase